MCVWRQVNADCGSFARLKTGIEQPDVIEKILTYLGLSAQPPQIAPARRVELIETA